MNRIIKAHLDTFSKNHGLESLSESDRFEHFANYSLVASKTGLSIDSNDITTGSQDDGIDGAAILIDEEIIVSDEDAKLIFKKERRHNDVDIIFVQSKTSESFDLGDFLKFKDSVIRFIESQDQYDSRDEVQLNAHSIFNICLQNVTKLRDGKPSFSAAYIALGTYKKPYEIEKAKNEFKNYVESTGLFSKVDVQFIGRDDLISLWVSTYSGTKAQLPVISFAPLPEIDGIEEAYLAVANAKEVVNKLLLSADGGLKYQVFEENVRAFLGAENSVNRSIAETLSNPVSSTRFPVLNNGITIVSQDVRVQGNIFNLENYQIVNGCQTSNVLFQNKDILNDKVTVNLKIVETSNEDVFSELVRATNSQTPVEENKFYSLKPIMKRVEDYFDTFEDQDGRLYLERREKQFVGREIPDIRIFSVQKAAQCVMAMFLNRPDLSYRYPKQMFEQYGDKLFSNDNNEIAFYASCLALYRLHLLVSNGIVPQNMRKFKWHILAILPEIITGESPPPINSKKISGYCQKIVDALAKHGSSATEPFQKAVSVVKSMGDITVDRLKRQAVLEEIRIHYSQASKSE